MFSNFSRFYKHQILTRPWWVCGVILSLSVAICTQIPNFRLDASAESLVLENDNSLKFYREVKAQYGSDDFLIVTYTPTKNLFDQSTIAQLAALTEQLSAIDTIDSVISILNVPLVNSPALSLSQIQQHLPTLLSEGTDQVLAQQELLTSPLYNNLLISSDSSTTALLLYLKQNRHYLTLVEQRDSLKHQIELANSSKLQDHLKQLDRAISNQLKQDQGDEAQLIKQVRTVLNQYRAQAEIHLGGLPMITSDSISFIRHDLINFGLVVLVFIITILAAAFGRVLWVLLPLFTCVVTGAVMIGFLGLVDWPVTVVSSNFIALMLILTLSLTIHLVVRYQELHWDHPDYDQLTLVSLTLQKKFLPCFFTAITTVVAFCSLLLSDIRPVIDFGWMMTIGITLAFIMAFTLFPATIMLFKSTKPVNQQNITERLTLFVANRLTPNQTTIFVSYIVIVAVSIFGLKFLSVENRFIDYFKQSTEIYQGMILIDQKLGGTTPLDIIIDMPLDNSEEMVTQEYDEFDLEFSEEDFLDDDEEQLPAILTGYWFNPTYLEDIASYHQYFQSRPEIGKVLSLASSMALINQIDPLTKSDHFRLSVVYQQLPPSATAVLIEPYITPDGNQIRFSLRIYESNKTLKRDQLISTIKQDLVNNFGLQPQQIRITGMLVLYNNLLQSLFRSQILTLGIVFFAILAMFLLLYKNLRLALITLLPNLIAATMVLGLMGWLNIPLDMMTITIAAICVGIAVDNSIHYVHRFKIEFMQSQNYHSALIKSHASIGRAMYFTSITITLGFSILVLSNFIPSIYFGLLTGFSMIVALIANTTLLPLLLIRFKAFGVENNGSSVNN